MFCIPWSFEVSLICARLVPTARRAMAFFMGQRFSRTHAPPNTAIQGLYLGTCGGGLVIGYISNFLYTVLSKGLIRIFARRTSYGRLSLRCGPVPFGSRLCWVFLPPLPFYLLFPIVAALLRRVVAEAGAERRRSPEVQRGRFGAAGERSCRQGVDDRAVARVACMIVADVASRVE